MEYEKLTHPYPLMRVNEREFGPFYKGPVYIWDVDKTYLDTRFSQMKDLLKIPLEFGVDKQAIPGTVALLQGLRDGLTGREHRPLYFVSASPLQLRRVIEKKMLLDGIEFDGFTFKDPVRLLFRGEMDQVKEQVAYKLSALMLLYAELPDGAKIYLFGDDVESDALVYSLFGDIAAGRLRGEWLQATLRAQGVRPRYARSLAQFVLGMPQRDLVERVYIRLARHPDGQSIRPFGRHVVGHATAAGAARHLLDKGHLSREACARVEAETEAGPVLFGAGQTEDEFLTPAEYLAR